VYEYGIFAQRALNASEEIISPVAVNVSLTFTFAEPAIAPHVQLPRVNLAVEDDDVLDETVGNVIP
jgi:hypothetical protein